MCKQHWERIMRMLSEKRVPSHVNLLEVRAYIYACYLENKIAMLEWNQFETAMSQYNPSQQLPETNFTGWHLKPQAAHSISCVFRSTLVLASD
jgi:hypothetical protein